MPFLPGNRFEALVGDRKGQFSIRINDRRRICFEWTEGNPGLSNVEIVDYRSEDGMALAAIHPGEYLFPGNELTRGSMAGHERVLDAYARYFLTII
jgi:hypothetical protein